MYILLKEHECGQYQENIGLKRWGGRRCGCEGQLGHIMKSLKFGIYSVDNGRQSVEGESDEIKLVI